MQVFKKSSPFITLGFLFLLCNFLLRIVFLMLPKVSSGFTVVTISKVILLGMLSDGLVYLVGSVFLWIYLLFLSNAKFSTPWGHLIFIGMLGLIAYISFSNTILDQYGGPLPRIVITFLSLKTALFALLLFLPKYRQNIRLALYTLTLFFFVFIVLLNTTCEYFFWKEFGLRYNFIAVDYLIYTHTVIRNIIESYPVLPIIAALTLLSTAVTYLVVKRTLSYLTHLPSLSNKLKSLAVYSALFALALPTLPVVAKLENSNNVYANEIQSNGFYKFYYAFKNSKLDYTTFYKTMPLPQAFALLEEQLPGMKKGTALRSLKTEGPELHKNVVLITIESFSAEFMKAYGNTENLTPFLDSLATQSLQFTNVYATGNRTVRGLEAVTLCLPPSPAESIIKQKNNKNKFSTASVFKRKGYQVKFLYGGNSYFDNMADFFYGNGYNIIDKKNFAPNEISFSNVWGVCDEDLYKKAIHVMNAEAKGNQPFFNHIMTVSNHRPFTYPNGKINIPNSSKSRSGGVKYTDYALRQFFKAAQCKPWFKNSVFVLIADHCASSAGSTQLPMDKYRIPALFYAPSFIPKGQITTLMSQIDIMPTLFGQLHFTYHSKFYGQDVLQPDYIPRAFLATYQDLGLVKNNVLTVLSPVKQAKQFQLHPIPNPKVKPNFQLYFKEIPIKIFNDQLLNQTIANYQTTAFLLKNNQYEALSTSPKK